MTPNYLCESLFAASQLFFEHNERRFDGITIQMLGRNVVRAMLPAIGPCVRLGAANDAHRGLPPL